MRLNVLIYSFLSFFSTYCVAQQSIQGKIEIDHVDNQLNLNTILVLNKNTQQRVNSDDLGNFKLKVQLNDELLFTSGFTVPRTFKITSNVLEKGFVNIHLDLEIIQLAEANIQPLKPNLKDNISKDKPTREKMFEIIGFDETFKLDMIKYRLALNYIKKNQGDLRYENVLKLKDDFDKDARNYKPEIRKEKERNSRMNEILTIKEFFTDRYFEEILTIPSTKIIDFISFCYDRNQFKSYLKQHNYDEIMFRFKEEAPIFLALLK